MRLSNPKSMKNAYCRGNKIEVCVFVDTINLRVLTLYRHTIRRNEGGHDMEASMWIGL